MPLTRREMLAASAAIFQPGEVEAARPSSGNPAVQKLDKQILDELNGVIANANQAKEYFALAGSVATEFDRHVLLFEARYRIEMIQIGASLAFNNAQEQRRQNRLALGMDDNTPTRPDFRQRWHKAAAALRRQGFGLDNIAELLWAEDGLVQHKERMALLRRMDEAGQLA